MVSTRGYVTDSYHTIALIPFCDLFNHSSRAHTSLLSDQCVCPSCGSLAACTHDEPEDDRIAHLSPQYIAQTEAEGRNVEMRAERKIQKGEQVYSCYEAGLGDGKLLVEWGFIGREKSGQGVTWRAGEVLRREDGRPYMAITQRGRVTALLSDALSLDASTRHRVELTDEASLFHISAAGAIGVNVLVACALRARDSGLHPDEVEEVEDWIVQTIQAVCKGDRGENAEALKHEVGQLVKTRLKTLQGDNIDVVSYHTHECCRTLTSQQITPGLSGLTAMAQQLRLDEIEMLRTVADLWQ